MRRLGAAAERAVWALVRACVHAGGSLRSIAEGLIDEIGATPAPPVPGQVFLWSEPPDAEPIPWHIPEDYVFRCVTLSCDQVPAKECVRRQAASRHQRNRSNPEKGQASDCPSCTAKCIQGAAIRESYERSNAHVKWKGCGPNGRFERPRADLTEQYAARQRQAAVGLLEPESTVDSEPAVHDERG